MTGATRSLLELLPLLVPAAAGASGEERARAGAIIEHALSQRPAAVRRQVALYLGLLRWLPLLRHGATLPRLPAERQRQFLSSMESSPIPILRKGFWGVRTLAFMGHYGRPEVGASLHYHPSRTGNDELRR